MEKVKEKKKSEKFAEEWQDCLQQKHSLPYTVLSSIDAALDGWKPYDFYYHKIYSPIWRVTIGKAQDKILDFKTEHERGKNGIAHVDVWNFNEYICSVMAKGLRILSDEIYGENPDWNELPNDSHYDRELYFKIQTYLETYNRLQEAYVEDCTKNNGIEWNQYIWMLQNSCYRQVKRIINEHMEYLWD